MRDPPTPTAGSVAAPPGRGFFRIGGELSCARPCTFPEHPSRPIVRNMHTYTKGALPAARRRTLARTAPDGRIEHFRPDFAEFGKNGAPGCPRRHAAAVRKAITRGKATPADGGGKARSYAAGRAARTTRPRPPQEASNMSPRRNLRSLSAALRKRPTQFPDQSGPAQTPSRSDDPETKPIATPRHSNELRSALLSPFAQETRRFPVSGFVNHTELPTAPRRHRKPNRRPNGAPGRRTEGVHIRCSARRKRAYSLGRRFSRPSEATSTNQRRPTTPQ